MQCFTTNVQQWATDRNIIGDRDEVCNCYEKHYLPHKPPISSDIGKLKGKVLICHCYPLRCHGDTLAAKANEAKG